MKKTEQYKTEDFYLAAFLVASGEQLVTHLRASGMTSFFFATSAKLNELISSYYTSSASINAMSYGTAIRNLKTVIHTDNTLSNQSKSYVQQFHNNQ